MEGSKGNWLAVVRILLLLASVTGASFGQYCLAHRWQVHYGAAAWLGALATFAAYLWGQPRLAALPAAKDRLRWPTEVLLATAAIGIGVFFKVYKLSEFPPGLNHDAAWEGQYALAILRGIPYTPFVSAAWGRETLTFYLRAPFVWWLGNVPLAVYLPSVIAGILCLPFFYWWSRTMWGARIAILATALFGVSGWSLVFSRSGWRSDFQPLFTILACCFFWRGVVTARTWPFVLAGVFTAATANTYNAGQAFPLVFLAWVPLFAWQGWTWRGFARRYGFPLAAGAVAFAAAIAPLAWYALTNWEKFFGRQSYLVQQYSVWDAIRATVGIFHYWANGDDFFVNTPGLEYWAALFFPFGLLWCVSAVRDPRAQFLLIGFLVGLLPGALSKPNMNRDIGTMPFVYLFAASGLLLLSREFARWLPRRWQDGAAALLCVAGVTASAWATYAQYLGPQRRPVWGYYPETTVLGRYLATLPPQYRVWIAGGNFPTDTLIYLTYRGGDPFVPRFTKVDDPAELLRMNLPSAGEQDLAFVFADETPALLVLAELRQRYPQHELVSVRYPPEDRGGRVFARVLLVPRQEATARTVNNTASAAGSQPLPTQATSSEVMSLSEPRGVVVFGNGTVVVSDFGHDRLVWFEPSLEPRRTVGRTGSGPGEFRQPTGLAIGPGTELFVCDTWNHRIQVLSEGGQYRRQYLASFFSPRGVAVTKDGTLFVADSGNNRVVVLDAQGRIVRQWDGSAAGTGAMREPVGIAVDESSGLVFVTDNGSGSVRVFSLSGEERARIAVAGLSLRSMSEPHLVWVPPRMFWINVPHAHKVRAYDGSGKLLHTVAIEASEGAPQLPMGTAVDKPRNRLLVTTHRGRLLTFPLPKAKQTRG